jgi:Zn-dependent protease
VGIAGLWGPRHALFFGCSSHFALFSLAFASFAQPIVDINLVLMVFNLVPLPPLDGPGHFRLFAERARSKYSARLYGFIFVIAFDLLAGEAIVRWSISLLALLSNLGWEKNFSFNKKGA